MFEMFKDGLGSFLEYLLDTPQTVEKGEMKIPMLPR